LSLRNSVIWFDGAFLRPNHFQQQVRYHDYTAKRYASARTSYFYGLESLELDTNALAQSKVSLISASGIFPDGTVFDLPAEAPVPLPLSFHENTAINSIVYLAVPSPLNGVAEVLIDEQASAPTRYQTMEQETYDTTSSGSDTGRIHVAQLRTSLICDNDAGGSFSLLPILRIKERTPDGRLITDPDFVPPAYDIDAVPRLRQDLSDLASLFDHRAVQISRRLGALGQSGIADVADFMMLQLLNRLSAQLRHLATTKRVHPERLHELFSAAAAELATFTERDRLPVPFPVYTHGEPHTSLLPLIAQLRRSLGALMEPNAHSLPLVEQKFGIYTASLPHAAMLSSCIFVLAVRAAVPLERLAKSFVAHAKISSVEKIRNLISSHLPGIALQPLSTAPRQLPYHAGYSYFLLDQHSPGWSEIGATNAFALHVAGDFPELDIQLWAIRKDQDSNR